MRLVSTKDIVVLSIKKVQFG